jgi:isochorismate synthase EntC
LRSTDDAFRSAVADAVAAIDRGELAKVVLARQADVTLSRAVDVVGLLRRWDALEPTCTLFSLPTLAGQFVGASPELLVERIGDRFRCLPLAGTTGRPGQGDGRPAELLESAKDGEEHRLVVEGVRDALAPLSVGIEVPNRPGLVHLHNMTHLGTPVTGVLATRDRPSPGEGARTPSALHLVAALHPTPAVGGVPRDAALDTIARLEPDGRGTYAGPVGFVDAAGDGRWVIGIRAVTVAGPTARMVAGFGVVRGSHPEDELVEATLKFTSVFDALAPGQTFPTSTAAQRVGERTPRAVVG